MYKHFSYFTLLLCLIINAVTAQKSNSYFIASPHIDVSFFTYTSPIAHIFQLPASDDVEVVTDNYLLLKAEVKNRRLHGSWLSYYPQAQKLDEGNLVKGVPDSEWKIWYANGQMRSLRTYNADLFQKVKQDVELKHPKISRFTVTERYKKEGSKVLRVLNAGYSFGMGAFELPATVDELVTDNVNNSKNYRPPFQQSLHHGLYMNWFENGVVKDSGYYKEGLKEGVWIHRKVAEEGYWSGAYHNGVHVNQWKYYSNTGKLLIIVYYDEQGHELRRKDF